MVIRHGFVSNSSTTSFTCEVCGASESGWDSVGIRDFGFFQCVNGHVLCEEHQLDVELTVEEMRDHLLEHYAKWYEVEDVEALKACDEEYVLDLWNDAGCNSYEVPETYCPVCQFLEISNSDTARFLLKETGIPREEAFAVVKAANKRRKKLYDSEYVMYVLQKTGKDISDLPVQLKGRFGTYAKFKEWLGES